MPKVNCAVLNYSNSTYKRKKWRQEICYEQSAATVTVVVNEKAVFIVYHHSSYTVFQAYWGMQS